MQEKTQTIGVVQALKSVKKSDGVNRLVTAKHAALVTRKNHKKIEESIRPIFSHIDCRFRFAEGNDREIKFMDEAYFELLKHWDRNTLYYHKGFAILVISETDQFSFEIFLNSRSKGVKRDEFKQTLAKIKEIQPLCKVYMGQNNPKKPIAPTAFETSLAIYLRKIAEKIKVKIVDQLIMSNTECFSFEENQYMQGLTGEAK